MSETPPEVSDNLSIETAEEQKIINDTIDRIASILNQSAADAHYATGELILNLPDMKHEDDGTFQMFDPTQTRQDLFGKVLDQIASRAKTETWLPKKTYLYNSINLVIDRKVIGDSDSYEALNISQKIALLKVKDIEEKRKLIEQIKDKPVRDAREIIAESTSVNEPKEPTLLSFIRKPDTIIDVKKIPVSVSIKKREVLVAAAQEKIDKIKQETEKLNKNLKNLEELLSKIENSTPPARGPKKGSKSTVH